MAYPTTNLVGSDHVGVEVKNKVNDHINDALQHNSPLNAASYGMVPSTTVDQGPALNSAIAAAASTSNSGFGRAVFIPQGWYRITTAIVPQSNVLVFGEGTGTFLHWDNTGVMLTLDSSVISTRWEHLMFFGNASSFTLVDINFSFAHNFTTCNFLGQHDPTGTAKPNQWGVRLRGNVGDTFFNTCRFQKLGQAMQLDWAVGNTVDQTHFSECYRSIVASHNNVAGMVLTNCTFASTVGFASQSPTHIDIEGSAGQWYIDTCWFEGALTTLKVGRTGLGGPSAFGINNTLIGSTTTNMDIGACRQPYIANCVFSNDGTSNPTHLIIDSTGAPEGTAINLVPHTGGNEIPFSVFPPSWVVLNRYSARLPEVPTATVQTIATGNTIALGTSGSATLPVTGTGTITGVILAGANYDGQVIRIVNRASVSMTFAAEATSRVAGGTAAVMPANRAWQLVWDSNYGGAGVGRWVRIASLS